MNSIQFFQNSSLYAGIGDLEFPTNTTTSNSKGTDFQTKLLSNYLPQLDDPTATAQNLSMFYTNAAGNKMYRSYIQFQSEFSKSKDYVLCGHFDADFNG